jgi:hypothetical protein
MMQCNPWLIGVVGLKDTLPPKLGRLLESEFKHRRAPGRHLLLLLLLQMISTGAALLG